MDKLKRHFMVDFETLGTKYKPMPTRLAVIPFEIHKVYDYDFFANKPNWIFDVFLSLTELSEKGFTITNETMLFWKKMQFGVCLPDSINQFKGIAAVLIEMENFVLVSQCDLKDVVLHTRGVDFESRILMALYEAVGREWPFAYDCFRDVRTTFATLFGTTKPELLKVEGPFVKHNPIHDCMVQIIQLQKAYEFVRSLINGSDIRGDSADSL